MTEKYDEVMRELVMRQRVYPRVVAKGNMTQAHAEERIALMIEIAADYEELAKKERLL